MSILSLGKKLGQMFIYGTAIATGASTSLATQVDLADFRDVRSGLMIRSQPIAFPNIENEAVQRDGILDFSFPPTIISRSLVPDSSPPAALVVTTQRADFAMAAGVPAALSSQSLSAAQAAVLLLIDDDSPSVSGVSPLTGIAGTTVVTISGSDFSTTASENLITFSGMTASVPASSVTVTATGMQLTVLVPVNAPPGTGPVTVTVYGETVTSQDSFTVQAPCTGLAISPFGPYRFNQSGAPDNSGGATALSINVTAPTGCTWSANIVGTTTAVSDTVISTPLASANPASGMGSGNFSLSLPANASANVLSGNLTVSGNGGSSVVAIMQATGIPLPPTSVTVPLASGGDVDVSLKPDGTSWGGYTDHFQLYQGPSASGPWTLVSSTVPSLSMFSPRPDHVEYTAQVWSNGGTIFFEAMACTSAGICGAPTISSNPSSNPGGVQVNSPKVTLVKTTPTSVTVSSASGGGIAPEQLYTTRLRPNTSLMPLGENAFGEQMSPITGSLSFLQRDIKLVGIGPDIEIYRSFDISAVNLDWNHWKAFADWDLELPRITATVTDAVDIYGQQNGAGWQGAWVVPGGQWTVGTNHSLNRCSSFGPDMSSASGMWYTDGVKLVLPGGGTQEITQRASGNTIQPSSGLGPSNLVGGSQNFPLITTKHWQIGCLPGTSNGQPGEAFFALSPDGTKYWFDNLVYDPAGAVSVPTEWAGSRYPNRYHASMLVTKIQDRFGNTLAFSYGGPSIAAGVATNNDFSTHNLLEISASDGRDVKISYNYSSSYQTTIQSISVQSSGQPVRTWSYNYGSIDIPNVSDYSPPFLQSLTQPDSSQWKFALTNLELICDLVTRDVMGANNPNGALQIIKNCQKSWGVLDDTSFVGTITAPSGLSGKFTVQKLIHSICYNNSSGNCAVDYCIPFSLSGWRDPITWTEAIQCGLGPRQHYITPSLVAKSYSGSGLSASQNWSYSYSPSQFALSGYSAALPVPMAMSEYNTYYQRYDANHNPYPTYVPQPQATVTAVNPDGSTIVSIYDNHNYDGDLVSVTRSGVDSNGLFKILSVVSYQYAPHNNGPFPSYFGANPFPSVTAVDVDSLHPLQQVSLSQSGDTYQWIVNNFDTYARPLSVSRVSPTGSITETTAYFNDTANWVVGQLQSVSNTNSNEVEQSNVYGGSAGGVTGLLSSRLQFGQTLFSYQWNTDGTLASFTDGNSHTTSLSNYKRGIPQKVTFPDFVGSAHPAITAVVDDLGQVTSVTDQNGATTGYGYDAMGRVNQISYPTGDANAWNTTTINYTVVGSSNPYWQRTETRGNQRKVTTYDAKWQPTLTITSDVTNPSNLPTTISQSTAYNWRGDVTFQSYPQNGSSGGSTGMWTDYDGLGRVMTQRQSSELGQLSTAIQYLSGVSRKVTDPNANVTTTSYLAYDKPDYSLPLTVSSPEGVTQTISRDPYGNPLSITQAGTSPSVSVTRSYTYDSYKRLCRLDDPESGSELRVYDAANNLVGSAQGQSAAPCVSSTSSLPASARVTRVYDEMNRVKTITYPSGTSGSSYTYDGRGAIKTATSGIASWTYSYTNLGPLQSETLSQSGNTYALSYGYDNNANLSQITYPDGTALAYSPDVLGRPTQAGSYASNIQYFADGKMSNYTLGNGVQYVVQENARQILQNLKYLSGGSAIFSEGFTYDKNANLKQVTDAVDGSRAKTMVYDGLDRLKSVAAGWGNEAYTYDGVNNLLSMSGTVSGQGESLTYTYDSVNRLSDISGTNPIHYTYDARGNVQTRSSATLTFDMANRLTGYSSGTVQGSYVYDAQGRRTRVVGTGIRTSAPSYQVGTTMVYSQSGRLMYQADDNWLGVYDYIYLNGQLIVEAISSSGGAAPTLLYRHGDHLGSTVLTSDVNGNVITGATVEFRPYGAPATGNPPFGPGFTGHFNDNNTGLTYMQARYYDPAIGRFISVDPSRLNGGFNQYAYVLNNPLNKTDPNGLQVLGLDSYAETQVRMDDPAFAQGQLLGAQMSVGPIAGLIPGVGATQGVVEAYHDPTPFTVVMAVVGAIPEIGSIAPTLRGIVSEARVLKNIGEVKNTEKVITSQGHSIPDFLNTRQVGEIKDTKRVTDTAQLRAQREHAEATGREHVVVTGTDTQVSKTVESQSTVIRRDDLGPQNQ